MTAFLVLFVGMTAYLGWTVLWYRTARAELYRSERAGAGPESESKPEPKPELTLEELAATAGHSAQLLLYEAVERGAVAAGADGRLTVLERPGGDGLRTAVPTVVESCPGGDLLAVEAELGRRPALREVRRGLAERGLLRDEELRRQLNRAVEWGGCAVPLVVVLGTVSVIWVAREHHNVLLPIVAFVLLSGLVLLVGERTLKGEDRRTTPQGERVLVLARRDPRWQDVPGRVALRGYHGLPAGHPLRTAWRASQARGLAERRRREEDKGNGGLGGV
ncbi:TIGR04222 domain-containing membrane protein [Kitasatospora sp. NPDC096077]|uniref:TIGR04222 domain-containing membrane protein n=1 Tax=Kitasatospora sp. NPDC096077 TaxID=3155544 RepID=UPI0033300CB7